MEYISPFELLGIQSLKMGDGNKTNKRRRKVDQSETIQLLNKIYYVELQSGTDVVQSGTLEGIIWDKIWLTQLGLPLKIIFCEGAGTPVA